MPISAEQITAVHQFARSLVDQRSQMLAMMERFMDKIYKGENKWEDFPAFFHAMKEAYAPDQQKLNHTDVEISWYARHGRRIQANRKASQAYRMREERTLEDQATRQTQQSYSPAPELTLAVELEGKFAEILKASQLRAAKEREEMDAKEKMEIFKAQGKTKDTVYVPPTDLTPLVDPDSNGGISGKGEFSYDGPSDIKPKPEVKKDGAITTLDFL